MICTRFIRDVKGRGRGLLSYYTGNLAGGSEEKHTKRFEDSLSPGRDLLIEKQQC
jgi:hypothetical protein